MKINVWGNAFHGLCTNGMLALANGDQMAYPQPESGSCSVIKFDGQPEVVLPVDLQNELTSRGMEFRNYALMSGNQIAGVGMPYSFIHRDDTGKRWGVDISDLSIQNNELSGNLALTHFGHFVETSPAPVLESQLISVQLSDCGQSSPVLTGNNESDILTSLRLVFASAHPSGNECVLTIEGKFDRTPASYNGWTPLGFILLEISGGEKLACNASIYINRANTIGVYSEEIGDNIQDDIWNYDTPNQEWTQQAIPPDDVGLVAIFKVGMFDLSYSLINRVINITYDSSGNKINTNFSFSYTENSTTLLPVAAGKDIYSSYSGSATAYAALEMAGNELRIDATGSGSGSVGLDFVDGEGFYYDSNGNVNSNIEGDALAKAVSNRFLQTNAIAVLAGPVSSISLTAFTNYSRIFAHKSDIEFYTLAASANEIERNRLLCNKLTDQLQGFSQTKIDTLGSEFYYNFGILSPVSFDDAIHLIPTKYANQYATYDPITGQIVWNSNVPVCFV